MVVQPISPLYPGGSTNPTTKGSKMIRIVTVYVQDQDDAPLEEMIEEFLRSRGVIVVDEETAAAAMSEE